MRVRARCAGGVGLEGGGEAYRLKVFSLVDLP